MATEVASKYSKTARKKAAKILQKAHDYIEQNGFDIQSYGRSSGYVSRCYLGTLRTVAGLDAEPVGGTHGYDDYADATEGDGPELILAMETLDKVAKPRLAPLMKKYGEPSDTKSPESFEVATGRYIEAVGLLFDHKNQEKYGYGHPKVDDASRADALKMLRKALTELYATGDLA